MISINGASVNVIHFPDGTQKIDIPQLYSFYVLHDNIEIMWKYESEEEFSTLIYLALHLQEVWEGTIDLYIPYLPNARMDRIHNPTEVFTLRSFTSIINMLGFKSVRILDAHSDVSVALIDRVCNLSPVLHIKHAIEEIGEENLVLYFPDAGAAKRYSNMLPEFKYCYGEKIRDWDTGKILGLKVVDNGIDLANKKVLMVDDIISYGGSLYYSAKELKRIGVKNIYAYATHTENSILNREKGTLIKALNSGVVNKLYTTDSIFTGEHEKISVEVIE